MHAAQYAALGKQRGGAILRKARPSIRLVRQEEKGEVGEPELYVLCKKSYGITQFPAETPGNPDQTTDRIGGVLAVQCLVRGDNPDDLIVLVPAEKALATRLISRVKDLLAEGRAMSGATSLSPRQREVLRLVVSNRANKEIASSLYISVRTVKFHVTALLSKFGVENRTDLARRAAGLLLPEVLEDKPIEQDQSVKTERRQASRPVAINAPAQSSGKDPSVRFLGTRFSV
jgi:DNA-binding CsgD family transcriptional regulator